jgi:hypothetical protein
VGKEWRFYTKKGLQAGKRAQKTPWHSKNGGGGGGISTNADAEEAIIVIIFSIKPSF